MNTRRTLYLCCLVAVAMLASCGHGKKKAGPSGYADDPFSTKLHALLKPIDTAGSQHIRPVAEEVRLSYQLDDYQPIWIRENYATNAYAAQLINELEDMRWDGFDPERYHVAALRLLKIKLDTTKNNSLEDAVRFDTSLTHAWFAAARDLMVGEVPPKKADSLWYHVNDTIWEAPKMLTDSRGVYPSLAQFRSKVPTYGLLRSEYKRFMQLKADTGLSQMVAGLNRSLHPDSATLDIINAIITAELPWVTSVPNDSVSEEKQLLLGYQFYTGLPLSGKFDSGTMARLATPLDSFTIKLRANMERVRWMQQQFGNMYVVVDVPLAELYFMKNGTDVMHMRVVVGKPERQTPSLFANMANVVINPDWGVPPTILKKDVIPGMQKSGKNYLNKKGLRVFDRKGKAVAYSTLNEHNYKNYSYKQAPGNDNSLGFVKFNLPNPWDIYLHDTPHRDDFGKRVRTLSSGCIRVQQPREMAVYILSELEKKKYSLGRLDTMILTHKTHWEVLKNKIPVHITYLTAIEDTSGKHIRYTRDVYNRDEKLISMMH